MRRYIFLVKILSKCDRHDKVSNTLHGCFIYDRLPLPRKNSRCGHEYVYLGRMLTLELKSFTQTVPAAHLKSKDLY